MFLTLFFALKAARVPVSLREHLTLIFIGDASMSPDEVLYPGGANEHWNAEPGETWL